MPGSPTLNLVPPDQVATVWPLVLPQIESVVARSHGVYTIEATRAKMSSGEWLLWVVWDGELQAIGCTQFYTADSGLKFLDVLFVTGEHSLAWLHLMDDLKEYGRKTGCKRISGTMRKGWAKRLPDWKMTHVILEQDL